MRMCIIIIIRAYVFANVYVFVHIMIRINAFAWMIISPLVDKMKKSQTHTHTHKPQHQQTTIHEWMGKINEKF